MRKRGSLPESLELLLDTMCNTFGGIMFIAIALIIISQLVTKMQKTMTPDEINRVNMERAEERIKTLQQEILKLEEDAVQARANVKSSSPESKKVIQSLAEFGKQNLAYVRDLKFTAIQIASAKELHKRLNEELLALQKQLQDKSAHIKESKDHLEKKKQQLQKKIAALQQELDKVQPRQLRFAKETNTQLTPYWILIQDNEIFRMSSGNGFSDEVRIKHINRKAFTVTLLRGKGVYLGKNPADTLNYLFRHFNQNLKFVSIVSDTNSFSTIFCLKEYFRTKGIKSTWSIDPEYRFYISENVQYKASD